MPRSLMLVVFVAALAVVFGGCATALTPLHATLDHQTDDRAPADAATAATDISAVDDSAVDDAAPPVLVAADYKLDATDEAPSLPALLLAQTGTQESSTASAAPGDAIEEEYDPWESFNEKMFEFNRRLDRYILKPVATAYNTVIPDRVQVMIANGFDNIQFVPRMMNSLFQGKFDGAVREFSRFLFNSTVGIGGLFDVAKIEGIEKSREDFGQTLGFYGVGPGPFLILPLLEPMTVRDGIGKGVDGFMDPLSYFLPFFWTRLLMKIEETVNDRSLNLELFQGFEESVIDMYSAVRHGYLKRREKMIKE